jgi:diaminopimelate epimerase
MQQVAFYKYQGTGNDFVMIDNRDKKFKITTETIATICDRRFGVGVDGLILLENHDSLDFKMIYYNSDGRESSMCGNGGRCIVSFAHFLGITKTETKFEAIDGLHAAKVLTDGKVSLQMINVPHLDVLENHVFTNTGSPHHVQLTDNLDHVDVKTVGRKLRNEIYGKEGANINFVQPAGGNVFKVRTYERGVEDETLSCGTGVTAVALAMHHTQRTDAHLIKLQTPGGELEISFLPVGEGYEDIWLTGPAQQVFKGEITC